MQSPDLLIHTKYHLPSIRKNLVPRVRLEEQVRQGLHGPLTLIIAPAGFGKTTLAASCITSCGMAVAWLSLDKNDNQIERFLRYLIASLQEAEDTIGRASLQLLAEAQQATPEGILTNLINELSDAACGEIALVLDDYQFINSQAVHGAVAFLLEHCPNTLHIMLVTRSDPALPLARLRAHNELTEIRTDELRFTSPETSRFLNHVMGLELTAEDIGALEAHTEGWIVGLQMAALALQGREDSSQFIQSFSGSHRYILEYLSEEVLKRQTEDMQSFLLGTSILDRLCGPLCDAVMDEPFGSQEKLEYLDKTNLFIVPLDEERNWYRYHHLFADLLRAQLQRSLGAEGVLQLHLRASEWHESNGSIVEAIHHASAVSDDERVERLIEKNYMELVRQGEMAWVRSWTGQLSKELVQTRPRLCIYEAYSHAWLGELDEADALLNQAEKRMPSERSTPEVSSMLGQLAYVRSRVTAMHGDLPRAIELNLAARELLSVTDLALQLDTITTLGYEYFLIGDYVRANQVLDEAIQAGRAAGAILTTVAAYCVLARLYAVQGLLDKSYRLYGKAEEWLRESGGQHLGATGVIEVGIADVLCEWNELDGALHHVKQGLALMPMWAKVDDAVLGHATLARIYLARSNSHEATEAVEKARQLTQASGVFSEARTAAEVAQVRLWLAQDNLKAADHWASSHEGRLGLDGPLNFENELSYIARARVKLAQKRPDEAIRLLSQLEEASRSGGRMGRMIEILLLKALSLRELGDPKQAILALTESLNLAEPEGYMRLFLDEGQPMQALLGRWLARSAPGPVRDYAIQLRSELDRAQLETTAVQERASAPDDLIEPLTQRELEVLRLMATGGTNQKIAQQLVVSRGTVKAHTANIYRKLDVANRTEAVARARQLGILS